MARAIAATAAALAALTALVLTGTLTGLDNWAIDHVMPGLDPYSDVGVVTLNGLWRPFAFDAVWWAKLLGAYLYPASFLISGLIATAVCVALYRRGRPIAAVVWLGAWAAANAVELTMKLALARPDVHWSNGARPIHVG